jgi:GTP cyclohydrolase I
MSGKINQGLIENGVSLLLHGLGVDLSDPNFLETPERVARMYVEMFAPREREWATFDEAYTDFIMLRGHVVYSLCPHHLLPVELNVSLAYIPNGRVLGLSKLARICDEVNVGPILQERFTVDLLQRLEELCPGISGAACLVDGQHGCTKVRGVKSDGRFTTYRLSGCFKEDPSLEERFFNLARR